MTMMSAPVVSATYTKAYGGSRHVTVTCPLCHEQHVHGVRIGERGVIAQRHPSCVMDESVKYEVVDTTALDDIERTWMAEQLAAATKRR